MQYRFENGRSYRIHSDGEEELMANFVAEITEETRYTDGDNVETWLTIKGMQKDKDGEDVELRELKLKSNEFPSMSWVMPLWGVRAVIQPGSGIKDDLRAAIQLHSQPTLKVVHRAIGWAVIGEERKYLHAGGAIGRKGNDKTVTVQVPPELSRYELHMEADLIEAGRATLNLVNLGPPEVMWTLLAGVISPLHGPVDFAIHLTGRTGTFKSEVCSLFQSHYGKGMDARHLPGSWSSTANALEAQAFYAKNAMFTVDDFVPTGTSWQIRAYQVTADKLIRAQGNQAGRARLTDVSTLQTTMYPRGLVLSTGEDTPEGHSVRARMMIVELSPGDIEPAKLTAAQNVRDKYPTVLAKYIQSLAEFPFEPTPLANEIRDENRELGHTRTPAMFGRMVASLSHFLEWCVEVGIIAKAPEANRLMKEMENAIGIAAGRQATYLETADPVEQFQQTLRHVFAAGLGHLRTLNGGIPKHPTILGWVQEDLNTEIPTFKSRGPTIGWIDWQEGEVYIDITVGYNVVKKVAGSEMTLTKQTLLKRLKDAGVLARADEARQRNTVRVTADGHPRQVIAMRTDAVIESQEVPDDE